MDRPPRTRFARLLGEALAIFVGVAAALAGQAWFEWRVDRAAERQVLGNVLVELNQNLTRLEAGLPDLRSEREELQRFSRFMAEDADASDADSIAAAAWRLVRSGGPGAVTFALDEALQTGNLRLIGSSEVRSGLASLRNGHRRLVELVDDHQDWSNGPVRAYLRQHGTVRFHYDDLEELAGEFSATRFPGSGAGLLESREFENIVRDKILWLLEIEEFYAGFIEHSAETRGLLERYLSEIE